MTLIFMLKIFSIFLTNQRVKHTGKVVEHMYLLRKATARTVHFL